MQHTAFASAIDDQTTTTSVVVPDGPLQFVTTVATAKVTNTAHVSIVAEPITTISTKEIGTVTTSILDLDEEMGKKFVPTVSIP
ncbi:hypothetical protein V6N13_098679 [Hibiscus sabdariffa]|uniref:Uncharacterized protein n=1 Tax=Hibiscus sabdariffa TaxID=183260 RepID=A0ABR2EEL6_9ROSI